MRQADRLFQIIEHLRWRGATSATELATALDVSEQQISDAVGKLRGCGVQIDGDADAYRLHGSGQREPSLLFDHQQLRALQLEARLVDVWNDPDLAWAAGYALAKADAGIGDDAYPEHAADAVLTVLQNAVRERRRVRFGSVQNDDKVPSPDGWAKPLALLFWGNAWTLIVWDEDRARFAHCRADQIEPPTLEVDDRAPFLDAPGQTLDDFFTARRRSADRGGIATDSQDRRHD